MLLLILTGALMTALLYLAVVLLDAGIRAERVNRRWRLLDEREPFYLDALTDVSLDPLLLPHH